MSLKQYIDEAIANVCIQIVKEPLLYFSEADIQQLVVEELRKITQFNKLYDTSVKRGKESQSTFKTSLIHREYGGEQSRRIDIVIFDPNDIPNITNVDLTSEDGYLMPMFAIELGTEKISDIENHLMQDINKLNERTMQTGYIVHIYKDTAQSRTGTGRRNNTEEKIERIFKQIFEAKANGHIEKIKILAILLRTYRDQKRMRGKCEIFTGNMWSKININMEERLKIAMLQQLQ